MKITVLGLGAMGSRISVNLLKAGFDLTIWNRSAEATLQLKCEGAFIASSPRDAVADADIVISMVRDDDASKRVWLSPDDGALAGMKSGAIGIESSTCTVSWIKALGGQFSAQGIDFLDAPVVGSRVQAEGGKLIYLVGGGAEVLSRVIPVLSVIGHAVHHAGDLGAGAGVKLLVNALLGIQVAMMAELLPIAEKIGLDPVRMIEILGQTPPCSTAAKAAADSMVAQNFSPAFPIELMEKDLGYLVDEAVEKALPISSAAWDVFKRAIAAGYGGENMTGVVQLYRM